MCENSSGALKSKGKCCVGAGLLEYLVSRNLRFLNLGLLKFEARAPHSSGQILAGFLRLSFHNFLQMTRLVKAFYSKGIYGQTVVFRMTWCKNSWGALKSKGKCCVGSGFARISDLQKFVISKSWSPKIWSSCSALKRSNFSRSPSIWNHQNFFRMIFFVKTRFLR